MCNETKTYRFEQEDKVRNEESRQMYKSELLRRITAYQIQIVILWICKQMLNSVGPILESSLCCRVNKSRSRCAAESVVCFLCPCLCGRLLSSLLYLHSEVSRVL